jgi:hypothetical protein
LVRDRQKRQRGGYSKRRIWDQSGWTCSTRHNWQGQGMPPRLLRLAPPGKPDLTVESPSAPITIPPAACLLQAPASRTPPMQPISAPTYEHTAARTRRKWGERGGGESIVAFLRPHRFWRFLVLNGIQGGPCPPFRTTSCVPFDSLQRKSSRVLRAGSMEPSKDRRQVSRIGRSASMP